MNARILLIASSLLVMSCVPTHTDRHYSGWGRHSDRSEIQDIRRACQAGNRRACVALGAAIEQRQSAQRDPWDWRERRWNPHDRWDRRDRRWDRNDRDNPIRNNPRFQHDNNPRNLGAAVEQRQDAERDRWNRRDRRWDRNDRDNPFLNDPRFQGGNNSRDDRENPFLNDPRFQGDHNPRD